MPLMEEKLAQEKSILLSAWGGIHGIATIKGMKVELKRDILIKHTLFINAISSDLELFLNIFFLTWAIVYIN